MRILVKILNRLARSIEKYNLKTLEKIRVAKLTEKERGYEWALEELYGNGKTIQEIEAMLDEMGWEYSEFDEGAIGCIIEETRFLNRKDGIRSVK